MNRFRGIHTLIDNAHPYRCHTVSTEEVVAAVECNAAEKPNESIRYQVFGTVLIYFVEDFAESSWFTS